MKAMKNILSFILAVVMILSVASFPVMAETAEDIVLTDIDTTTAVGKAVTKLVSRGIINGYEDRTYRPDNPISRAEFCVVMVKFEGMQDFINPEALTGFEDLDTDANYAWARPYVAMAVQRGIINGFEDGTFRAADPVTYEQAIKMLVCSLGYGDSAKFPTITNDWSSGYIAKAMQLQVTSGTSISNKTQPTTRGIVAILTSNALGAEKNTIGVPGLDIETRPDDDLGFDEIKGIVTGTFITELEDADSGVPKNHIQIDDEIYEVGFSRNPNEYLGCLVEAVVYEENKDGDYPIVKSLELATKNDVVTVEAGLLYEYDGNEFEYLTSRNGKTKSVKLEEEPIVIYNNKLWDYDLADLSEELVSGNVEFIDNDGDKRYEVVRINSYDVFVVYSKSSSTQKITLMYDALYEGEETLTFPADSTQLVFSLTRNGKEIKFNDIAKWDVLNIKASPEDAEGKRLYEVVVTRETVSGEIKEIDSSDERFIVIGDEEYQIADSFFEYEDEDKPQFTVGEFIQVYLDAEGKIVAAAEAKNDVSSEKYAYLLALRQDSDDSEYDLEFRLYSVDGKIIQIGSAAKITIDGTKYKALDEDILDYLEVSAEEANEDYYNTYPEEVKFAYHQPIIYQTNSSGLISVIHTVKSTENEDISKVMNTDEEINHVAYDHGDIGEDGDYTGISYKSSSKSFGDFKVSSSTDIIFVPDNRGDTDDYLTFSSYSKAFANGRKYHVEAFGLTSSKTASLVLIYKENDSRMYTSSTPWMIVASKSETKDGTVIKGYAGTSYSLKNVTVSEDDGPSVSAIGKGDIIRYILDGNNELVDYQIWFDASNPSQLEPVSTNIDLFVDEEVDMEGANRIIEIHSTSTKPRHDYPNATFRLQYGTVTEIILKDGDDDDTVDEESITVSPVIVEDGLEMDYFENEDDDNNSTISKEIGSSVKVFSYDRGGRNSEVVTDADLSEILDYATYGEDATRVIVYTASATLRMIYIVTD